jgi:DinB superfamily
MRDIPDLLDGLKRTPRILSRFVQTIPESRLDLRRGDGFWTVAEHVSHLVQVQPMLLQRMERFMDEDHPEFVPFLPGKTEEESDTPPRMSMESAFDQFVRYRAMQLRLLERADAITWDKAGTHPEYELYSLYILTRHVLMHDHWHMYRMEELWLTRDAYLTRLE